MSIGERGAVGSGFHASFLAVCTLRVLDCFERVGDYLPLRGLGLLQRL